MLNMNVQHRKRNRASQACNRCRQKKLKCSGAFPCSSCSKRSSECIFDQGEGTVVVSKQYLEQLQKSSQDNTIRTTTHDEAEAGASNSELPSRQDSTEAIVPNPLEAPAYVSDPYGRSVHLGTSSSNWSFVRRLLLIARKRLGQGPLPPDDLSFDGTSYELSWPQSLPLKSCQPVLPARDFALYLIHTVKHHCHQLLHLFDETVFMKEFDQFYDGTLDASPLWHAHYYLLLAFGKAFVVRNMQGRKPPGADFFEYAMGLITPHMFSSIDNPRLAQALCCAALYTQCLDYRAAAYRLIGQALRVAFEEDMHNKMRYFDESVVSTQDQTRIWWTIYILDRQMSSLMGVPLAIADEAINTVLPTFPDQPLKSIAWNIQINLSKVLAQIMDTVYGAKGNLDQQLLSTMKAAIRGIAVVTDQLNASFPVNIGESKDGISRLSGSLHLLHHQCMVLTTRPLLSIALQSKFHSSSFTPNKIFENRSVASLIKMCVDYACRIVDLLCTLRDQDLLGWDHLPGLNLAFANLCDQETFLRSDLDAAFVAQVVLITIPIIESSFIREESTHKSRGFEVFESIILSGNLVAITMKTELHQLEESLAPLKNVPESKTPVLDTGVNEDASDRSPPPPTATHTGVSLPTTDCSEYTAEAFSVEDDLWHWDFSTEQLLTVANSLDFDY